MNDNKSDYKRGAIYAYTDILLVLDNFLRQIPETDRIYIECFYNLIEQIQNKKDEIKKNPAF